MKSIASRITAILFVFGLTLGVRASCNPGCRFSFCPSVYNNAFNIGQPDKAFTTAICDPSGKVNVGHVDSTGEAYVQTNYGYVPISQYKPEGLLQNFSPSFFKSYGIYEYGKDLSGIGHETPQQNQGMFLNDLCVSVPLTAYQVLDNPYGTVIDNIHPQNPYTDCVSFTTYVPHGNQYEGPPSGGSNVSQMPKNAGGEIGAASSPSPAAPTSEPFAGTTDEPTGEPTGEPVSDATPVPSAESTP